MIEAQHPSELNIFQQYRRTVKVAKTTSRMKNPDWYRDALDLDVQIHCYLKDNSGVTCYLHVKSHNLFEKIEGLNSRQLEQRDELEKFIDAALAHEAAKKAKSIGVVFYLADEFSIAGLGPEHQNPVEINNLRAMMLEDPMEVLDDKTVSTETHSWRLFPYPGAAAGHEFATVVAVSRRHSGTLKYLREIGNKKNLPIRTCALSAPLCAIASLPWFTTASEHGAISVFNYETFTLLAFFNRHCDLMMLRFMPHANGAGNPTNLGPAVMATATAFELESPEISVLSMVGNDMEGLIVSLQSSMMGSDILLINAEEILKSKGLPADLPIEYMVTTEALDPEVYPLGNNETFTSLREDLWHLQDFLSPAREEVEMFPAESDMRLLKIGRRAKMVAVLVLGGILAYAGVSISGKVKSDAWSHKSVNSATSAIALTAELKRYEHWDNLLMDRSKAWVSMELVARLTPTDGSVVLKDVNHRVIPKPGINGQKTGFTKEWVINGYGSDKGVEYLERFSTRDGIKKLFKEVARKTGNEAYLPDVSKRDVTVNLKQRPNPTYNTINPQNPGDMFRRAFTITISQTFSGEDKLAIAAIKTTGNTR
ncbi:MAG: hypothetical protein H7A51_19035 [Akkermansiaceae bacterium]|nr:hypothetical protein [Akkermansiaceae bacterium]